MDQTDFIVEVLRENWFRIRGREMISPAFQLDRDFFPQV